MVERIDSESCKFFGCLCEVLVEDSVGQVWLDKIIKLIVFFIGIEVCLIYLFCDVEMLEFCVIEGLKVEVVYQICMCFGEGFVGCVVKFVCIVNIVDVFSEKGFCYMLEIGEEIYLFFCGVFIQCLGE